MESIFGLPMSTVLIVVVGIMALCLLLTLVIGVRQPVVARMALRNLPRRRVQSGLIMVGLMLSTLIISASLTTGDTLNHSTTNAAWNALGGVDELVVVGSPSNDAATVSVTSATFDDAIVADIERDLAAANPASIAGLLPLLTVEAPAQAQRSGLSEPAALVTGFDPARLASGDFGTLRTPDGDALDPALLTSGAAIISEALADDIDAQRGDTLTLVLNNTEQTVTVAAVARDSMLTGYASGSTQAGPATGSSAELAGMAVPLAWLQEVSGLPGQIRAIAVTNTGGVRDGMAHSDDATAAMQQVLASAAPDAGLVTLPVKQETIATAEAFGTTFSTLFLLLGMFSITAGILLIFLIFTMLAAERRPEIGMARAIGMTRAHVVQGFIVEGTAYALGAALIGSLAGVGASLLMTGQLSGMFGDSGNIEPHASLRSIVVAFALGMTVTFITVVFASLRASRLSIVAAIRDLPDNAAPERRVRPIWRWVRPAAAGVRGSLLVRGLSTLVWDIALLPLKLVVWVMRLLAYVLGWGPLAATIGGGIMVFGAVLKSQFVFSFGVSLFGLGAALLLRRVLPPRLAFSLVAFVMLLYWLLPFAWVSKLLPWLNDGGPEMLFVSGISMVGYLTLILMWNVSFIVSLTSLLGRSFSRWVPAVKTAVAYPLASPGRTGLTIAMFSLVLFSLVTVRTISVNFSALYLSDAADGGWDISVVTSPSNPIDDFSTALQQSNADEALLSGIGAVGRVDVMPVEGTQARIVTDDSGATTVVDADADMWMRAPISGLDAAYVAAAEVPLDARAPGYADDAAVWQAITAGEPVALVDMTFFETDEDFGGGENMLRAPAGVSVENLGDADASIPAMTLELRDPRSGTTRQLTIIGVIDAQVSTLQGVFMPSAQFTELYGAAPVTRFVVQQARDAEGTATNADDLAQEIEATLRTRGVQAESIAAQIREQQEQSTGFFTLVQSFMGLGLFVGLAALGVISYRSVVERRQQIGMLRAIGFQRSMVGVSFVIESLVVALLGVVSGCGLAIALSYNLITGGALDENVEFPSFVIPWSTMAFFVGTALIAAALLTWIPARRAAAVPIAEALRYE